MAEITVGELLDFLDELDGNGIIVTDTELIMSTLNVSDVDEIITIGE